MLIIGERHLKYIVTQYVEHYHTERPHQGLDNEIIEPPPKGLVKSSARNALVDC